MVRVVPGPSFDWHLLDADAPRGLPRLVADLKRRYRSEPAPDDWDCGRPCDFGWSEANHSANSALTYLGLSSQGDTLMVAANFTPQPRHGYRVGVPQRRRWEEILNTDAPLFGDSGEGNLGGAETGPLLAPHPGRPESVDVMVPPLGVVVLEHVRSS